MHNSIQFFGKGEKTDGLLKAAPDMAGQSMINSSQKSQEG